METVATATNPTPYCQSALSWWWWWWWWCDDAAEKGRRWNVRDRVGIWEFGVSKNRRDAGDESAVIREMATVAALVERAMVIGSFGVWRIKKMPMKPKKGVQEASCNENQVHPKVVGGFCSRCGRECCLPVAL